MAQQLKRWESPRRKGRNHKGRGGSAKQRQYIKRQKLLRKRLQAGIEGSASDRTHNPHNNGQPKSSQPQKPNTLQKGKDSSVFPFLMPLTLQEIK
ncbi:MAG: hypothetical protein AAF171_27075 [Cyanobacteria bacterium P01_A01_bin.116]